jgi:hypothetical protein
MQRSPLLVVPGSILSFVPPSAWTDVDSVIREALPRGSAWYCQKTTAPIRRWEVGPPMACFRRQDECVKAVPWYSECLSYQPDEADCFTFRRADQSTGAVCGTSDFCESERARYGATASPCVSLGDW